MSYFATPDGELSPAEAELSAGLSRIAEAPTCYVLLFLVVNHTVVVHLVPIAELCDAGGWWAR